MDTTNLALIIAVLCFLLTTTISFVAKHIRLHGEEKGTEADRG
jgi:hypothetical protein